MVWNTDELEIATCDLCKRDRSKEVIRRSDGLVVVECDSCGLCFVSPRPKMELMNRLYSQNYFRKKEQSKSSNFGYTNYITNKNCKQMLKESKKRYNLFREVSKSKLLTCLEVGCATGEFCETLRLKGISVKGIDISAYAIADAKKRYPNVNFRCGNYEIIQKNEFFDAIFAFEVIEHLESPKSFFKASRQHLKENGFLVLTTPNYDCGNNVGLQNWRGFKTSFEHIYYLDIKTITQYAKKEGLYLMKWFTGGGTGLASDVSKKERVRQYIREITTCKSIHDITQKFCSFFRFDINNYQVEGMRHNLFAVFSAT